MSLALVILPVLVFAALLVSLLPVVFRLFRQCHVSDVNPEWLESFSAQAYYPMEDLLGDEDFRFLARQPGFESALHVKLRQDRLRIFRQYLNRLVRDFNRLHMYCRFLVANSPTDQSDLLVRLVQLRVRFALTVLQVEAGLMFGYFGFRPALVRQMIVGLEEMASHFNTLGVRSVSARA